MSEPTLTERSTTIAVVMLFVAWPIAGCSPEDDLPFDTFATSGEEPEALLEGMLILNSGCLAVLDDTGKKCRWFSNSRQNGTRAGA